MTESRSSADLALALGALALERQAQDLVLLDLRDLTTIADFMIILSGRSTRQVQSLSEHILREGRSRLRLKTLGREGAGTGNWVLIDYGGVIVHVFLDEVREYYDLEGLWSDAPVYRWSEGDGPPPIK